MADNKVNQDMAFNEWWEGVEESLKTNKDSLYQYPKILAYNAWLAAMSGKYGKNIEEVK